MRKSDLYQAIEVAISSNRQWPRMCPRGGSLSLHSMQFFSLLLNVYVESLSFKKTEEEPGPLRSSSGAATAVLKILSVL